MQLGSENTPFVGVMQVPRCKRRVSHIERAGMLNMQLGSEHTPLGVVQVPRCEC